MSHNSVPATELFHKNGDITQGKLTLQHVAATRPLVCAGLLTVPTTSSSAVHTKELVPRNMSPTVCRP